MELQRGTLLQGGKYRIEQTLGRGGFGVTYLATHMALGGSVCIKEFFPQELCQRAADGSAMATISERSAETIAKFKTKFWDEARKLFYIKHPNIVGVSDLFEENSTAYYVMEYIEGESLKSRIDRCGALSENDARRYVGQVAAALRDIHRNGMLHLDIKPANIMLRAKDDTAVVIDFGLAKHYDPKTGEQTTTYVAAHSPGYAPLEQSTSGIETFSPAADIYSLGATLYAMVTGVQPPKASVIMNEGLPELPSTLSPSLRNAIERSMELVIKRRPQDIDTFMVILGTAGVAGDNRGGAKPAKPKTSTPKKRIKWWLWLLLLLIAVGGFVGYIMLGDNKPEPEPTNNYTETAYGVDMSMVWVEGGSFKMGCSDIGDSDEQPVHNVTLDGYWIGATEVTQAQWESVMGTDIRQQRDKADSSWSIYGEGSNYPMYYVNYDEAKEFCRRLSERTGRSYTLPTEAQWEYAARGGRDGVRDNYTYSGSNSFGPVAWYNGNNSDSTHPVGRKSPNQLGLYDMSGNVWEWCLDRYGEYSSSNQTNPTGPSSGDGRVVRGGSWHNRGSDCRVASRSRNYPSSRRSSGGFRVVCLP